MELSPLELKFLLRLLEHSPDYRTRISQIKPESKTRSSERDRLCESLCSKGLIEYIDEIKQYQTESAGKTLLKVDTETIPISANELALLKAAESQAATPGQANKVPAGDRQPLLHQLKDRGLIRITKRQIGDVWLTPQGIQYLLNDCAPTSPHARLPFSLVGSYLAFLRRSLNQAASPTPNPSDSSAVTTEATELTPEAVLEKIRQLDQQLHTDNFLPIFHLREKLQPPLSREELDQMLYELQGEDLIELITLQEVSKYDEAEISAGIPQGTGGVWFYISVSE
ncbi:hypothetical protein C7271_01170 [filamentous cyanobacterium CCP5]|nr:hypothetical protein C7271_01170 [filamentous cyanobacterium CCP5]